jgi:hypothetical protein
MDFKWKTHFLSLFYASIEKSMRQFYNEQNLLAHVSGGWEFQV